MATSRVRETLHLEKTHLVQAPSKDINNVSIMRGSLCQVVIELLGQYNPQELEVKRLRWGKTYLQCFFIILDVIAINVMM